MKRYILATSPLVAAIAWLATLIALLVIWLRTGRPRYKPSSGDVSYISNIGAMHDPIFITGAAVTGFFIIVSLIQFIILHKRRIAARTVVGGAVKDKIWADYIAFFCGFAASACLLLLTIYDSLKHESLHWILTLSFAFLIILCAIFNLIGVSSFRSTRFSLHSSFVLKLLFIVFAFVALVSMIGLMYSCSLTDAGVLTDSCNKRKSAAAVLEWFLASLLVIFLSTWIIDFLKN